MGFELYRINLQLGTESISALAGEKFFILIDNMNSKHYSNLHQDQFQLHYH